MAKTPNTLSDAKAVLRIRAVAADDLAGIVRLDAELTGTRKHAYWKRVFRAFAEPADDHRMVGLVAEAGAGLAGYLVGEVRAFEFGSEPCGWILAVGVSPAEAHHGVGSALVAEACRRFRAEGMPTVRTMVKKDDLPMLSFFRASDFVGGPYVQLERSLADQP